jgi:hypothetical protein
MCDFKKMFLSWEKVDIIIIFKCSDIIEVLIEILLLQRTGDF